MMTSIVSRQQPVSQRTCCAASLDVWGPVKSRPHQLVQRDMVLGGARISGVSTMWCAPRVEYAADIEAMRDFSRAFEIYITSSGGISRRVCRHLCLASCSRFLVILYYFFYLHTRPTGCCNITLARWLSLLLLLYGLRAARHTIKSLNRAKLARATRFG